MHAFAALVERYRDAAYGIGLHVLGEPHEAADVAQDAFIRAYRCLHQLKEPSRFSAWLCRIAANLARRRLVSKRAARSPAPLENVGEVADPGPSGPEALAQSEVVGLIRQLMQQLPDQHRLTFTLFYVNGYSHKDLSAMLDVPVGTVKSRLSNARSRLRKEIVQMAKEVMEEGKPDAEFWRSATGTITGHVTCAATGAPIERAEIQLLETQTRAAAHPESAADGVWEAKEVVPGAYQLTVRHHDFVRQRYRKSILDLSPSVVVRPGQTVSGVDFQLEPAGRIRGKVLGADGSPVTDAHVLALSKREPPEEGICFKRVSYARTDDDGRFDVGSLPPDAYLLGVQAGEKDDWAYVRPMIYYPGTFSLHDAEWVQVSAAAPIPELVIRLAEAGTATLRVEVTDSETGEPIAGARVHLIRRDAPTDEFMGRTDDSGWFRSPLLTRGPFQVTVGAAEQGYPKWSKWIDTEATQQEVEMRFQLPKGAVFEGSLVTEGGSEPLPLEAFFCFLEPDAPDQIDGRPRREADIGWAYSNGQCRFLGMREGPQTEMMCLEHGSHLSSPPVAPGKVKIRARVPDEQWRVMGVSVAAQLLLPGETFECKPNERIDSLRIVLGTNLGVVAGRVVSAADNEPIEGAWVHLSRQDKEPFRAFPMPTDRSGSFLFHSVPAGLYLIGVARQAGDDAPVEEDSKREIVVEPNGVVHLDLVLLEP